MKIFRKNAMTLVEVLITLAIFSLMLEAIYSSLVVSQKTWLNYTHDIAPKQQLRLAMTLMVNELREAGDTFIVKEEHRVELTFHRAGTGEVVYAWTDTGPDAHKIIRSNYEQKRVLAYNIMSLSFTTPTTDEIIIEIGNTNKEITLKEKVALRSRTGLFVQSENEKIK